MDWDLPPPSNKRLRVARNLSSMPLELVEPVLRELLLHHVMELAFISPPQPVIRAAVTSSPSWRFFFQNRMAFAERIWHSLNRLSWLWCRQPWMQTLNKLAYSPNPHAVHASRYDYYGGGPLTRRPPQPRVGQSVNPLERDSWSRIAPHEDLEQLFLKSFKAFLGSSNWIYGMQPHQLAAMCLFLPQGLLAGLARGDVSYLREPLNLERLSDNYQDYLGSPMDEVMLRDLYAAAIIRHNWQAEDAQVFLMYLSHAYRLLGQAWSAELSFLADLYERFPCQLKQYLAPQSRRSNHQHIVDGLRRDAQRALSRPLRSPSALNGPTRADMHEKHRDESMPTYAYAIKTNMWQREWKWRAGVGGGGSRIHDTRGAEQTLNDSEMEDDVGSINNEATDDVDGAAAAAAAAAAADGVEAHEVSMTDDPNIADAPASDGQAREGDEAEGQHGGAERPNLDDYIADMGRRYDAEFGLEPGRGLLYRGWYRFRYPSGNLLPYDWCLRLFLQVLKMHPLAQGTDTYPPELLADVQRAQSGLEHIYQHGESSDRVPLPRYSTKRGLKLAFFNVYHDSACSLPKPPAELEWLRSFATAVNWMTTAFPELTASVQRMTPATAGSGRVHKQPGTHASSMSQLDYEMFISQKPASAVAAQIYQDSMACREGERENPSLLALFMPSWTTPRAKVIGKHFPLSHPSWLPSHHLSADTQQLMYESKIASIRSHLRLAPRIVLSVLGEQELLVHELAGAAAATTTTTAAPATRADEAAIEIDLADLETTARTLQKLLDNPAIPVTTSASEVLLEAVRLVDRKAQVVATGPQGTAVKAQEYWDKSVAHLRGAWLGRRWVSSGAGLLTCYMCRLQVQASEIHPRYRYLCILCGNFNHAGSKMSTPENLRLEGKNALVTGARVNLGFFVALQLLRCGANVIVSTRYPRDALERYQAEPDAPDWIDRLRIVGADFRAARDAFNLVEQVAPIIRQWGGRLHILINNAAQTLTDSIRREEKAIQREQLLLESSSSSSSSSAAAAVALVEHSYQPRVRGGAVGSLEGPSARLLASFPPRDPQTLLPVQQQQQEEDGEMESEGKKEEENDDDDEEGPSSWVQRLADIPYEDIISAHSVNAFVPLILLRELLPLMASSKRVGATYASDQWPPPRAHVVNVSSREGIFENKVKSGAKNARHVHTNMSKAALNMITETEAASAWRDYRVAINTVDPGYMSAAPEITKKAKTSPPLGWEDGAGRVLWPIAMGEMAKREDGSGGIVYGRFLKHYGAMTAEPGR